MIVWRDGALAESGTAVSAADRGYLVGDAVFETMLVDCGRPAFLEAHLARLGRGAEALNIPHMIKARDVRAAIAQLAKQNGIEGRAACRLTASRVGGRRGLAPSPEAQLQILISLAPIAPAPKLMRVAISNRVRWSGASTNAFKCAGACAENLLARMDAVERGADEAIMLNESGRIACASAANLFVAASDGVTTPPLSEGAMPGVVRGVVLEEARRLGVAAREVPIEASNLQSGELLLTNSLVGVAQSALDGAVGASSPLARELIAAYEARLAREFAG